MPHCRAADPGGQLKQTDQSRDIISSELWGKSSFLLVLYLLSSLCHHPPAPPPLPLPSPRVCSWYSGCRRWHEQTWIGVWIDQTSCSGPTAQTLRWGSRRGSALVQSSAKPECLLLGVCVCVIEKRGFPQRDPPLIVKWRSPRATPGTSIKHRQATDNLSLPTFFFSHPLSPSLIYPLKFKFTFKFKQGSLPWKEKCNVGKAATTHKRK